MPQSARFSDRLAARIRQVGSPICVGLDPVLENLPPAVRAAHHDPLAAIADFTRGVIDAVAPHVAAVKFQSACFERYGSGGVGVLEQAMHHAAEIGVPVVLDAKRGDIAISAEHYAAAAKRAGAHAITVSGYLGPETIKPYLKAGMGVFVLVRTSNPDSDQVQEHALRDGRTVAEMMADLVAALGTSHIGGSGLSDVGAVVGATKTASATALRTHMPAQIFLIPGYGAQGGKAEDIRAMLRRGRTSPADAGVLVTSSRAIINAGNAIADKGWKDAVADAAHTMAKEIAAIVKA